MTTLIWFIIWLLILLGVAALAKWIVDAIAPAPPLYGRIAFAIVFLIGLLILLSQFGYIPN